MSRASQRDSAATGPAPEPAPEAADRAARTDAPVPELAGRAEQVGAIIVKTLDLAEAGLSLGITVLTRAGAAAQGALVERAPAGRADAQTAADAALVGDHAAQPAPHSPPGEDDAFFLVNRMPLAPGGTVNVSFSITNDSLLEPRRVLLRVDDLVGDRHGVRIDGSVLTVRPARRTIPPMDFDKFVLTGTLPAVMPPDTYRGAVVVSSTDAMSIPVCLEVGGP